MRTQLTVLALLALASVATAAPGDTIPHPQVTAVRLDAPLVVDGILNESVWQSAPAFTAFVQSNPVEGAPPSERTEVRIAFDDEALYVGARMWDSHPDSIMALLTRRDVSVQADRFCLYLDPYLDRRSGYYFMVNAAGVMYDGTLANDGGQDDSWDGVWRGAAHRDDKGWTCEMRIPFSQLRFNHDAHQVWGIDFYRAIPRKSEDLYLAFSPRNASGFVSRFGDLVGLAGIQPVRAIEVMPYVTSKGEFLQHSSGDPFHSDPRYTPAGGGDVRTSLGSRLTLNATINPDFGQVEVDPAVVNLSDVESYFAEKRPFFVEGSHNFRFGNEGANDYWSFNWSEPTFFYSRRIGRAPEGSLPSADFSDVPVATRILGAAKVTGKITPTTNFGFMSALTGREFGDFSLNSSQWSAEMEPLTYYGAVHALKEFKDRRQGLGLMTTVVQRSFDGSGLQDELNRSSLMVGSDGWLFLDRSKTWVVSGYTAVTHVEGTQARITDLQESSLHYLQRPDRVHDRLDPNATSLDGFVSRYWLNKQSGAYLTNAAVGYISPGFDVNDMGFMTRSGVLNAHYGTGWQWTKNSSWKRYANVLGTVFSSWNADGDRTVSGVWSSARATFANNWNGQVNVDYIFQGIDDRNTRGGPVMLFKPGDEYYASISTDPKQKISYSAQSNASTWASGSFYWNVNPYSEWRPSSSVTLSLGPGYERTHEVAQYVTNQADPAATATYGEHNVFATLDQRTLYLDLRLNWAFSPRLTLQLFAQPLVSSAAYTGYKELARPRSFDFTPYPDPVASADGSTITLTPPEGAPFTIDTPYFNFRSLRGNAVLRWEYLPGSAVYLVWTQQRTDQEYTGEFEMPHSIDRLVQAKADNIFLVKATKYFTM